MEPLWSPVVATGGNQWQIESPRKRQKQAETVAVGCDRLPIGAHGKEGVSGSSPEEGSGKDPQTRLCFRADLRNHHRAVGMEPLWSLQAANASGKAAFFAVNAPATAPSSIPGSGRRAARAGRRFPFAWTRYWVGTARLCGSGGPTPVDGRAAGGQPQRGDSPLRGLNSTPDLA